MNKYSPYLSDIHSTLMEMYERQQQYIEDKASAEALSSTLIAELVTAKVQAVETSAREDILALCEKLKERALRFAEASKDLVSQWDNSGSTELQNLFNLIELNGKAITRAQAISTAECIRGDYVSLAAVAVAYDKAKNVDAAEEIRKLMPDIGAAMQKMIESAELIKGIAFVIDKLTRPYYELCKALGHAYNPNEFENLFEMDQWRREAGLIN